MSEELAEEYFIWRLVNSKKASLQELSHEYNYTDACKLSAIMDMEEDYERYHKWQNDKKNKK